MQKFDYKPFTRQLMSNCNEVRVMKTLCIDVPAHSYHKHSSNHRQSGRFKHCACHSYCKYMHKISHVTIDHKLIPVTRLYLVLRTQLESQRFCPSENKLSKCNFQELSTDFLIMHFIISLIANSVKLIEIQQTPPYKMTGNCVKRHNCTDKLNRYINSFTLVHL